MLKNYVATYMGIITIEAVVNLLIQTTYCIRNNTTKTSSQISNDWIQISSLWAETVRKNKQVLSCDHLVVRSIGTKITEQISICDHLFDWSIIAAQEVTKVRTHLSVQFSWLIAYCSSEVTKVRTHLSVQFSWLIDYCSSELSSLRGWWSVGCYNL